MPVYLQSQNWLLLWPLLAMSSATAALAAVIYRGATIRMHVFYAIAAFAFIGAAAGYIAGYSREPAVGTVIPAILSLIGGLASYIVGTKKADVCLVSLSVFMLAVNLVIGITWGSERRSEFEVYRSGAEWRAYESQVEQYLVLYRRNLGLKDYPVTSPSKTDDEK